jgi:hypothetical protein
VLAGIGAPGRPRPEGTKIVRDTNGPRLYPDVHSGALARSARLVCDLERQAVGADRWLAMGDEIESRGMYEALERRRRFSVDEVLWMSEAGNDGS